MKKITQHWTALGLVFAWSFIVPSWAAETKSAIAPKASKPGATGAVTSEKSLVTQGPVELLPGIDLSGGKSMLLRLSEPALRISIGNPDVADVTLINAREV